MKEIKLTQNQIAIVDKDAAKAYNIKALELHGEFARLNIIKP